MNVIVVISLIKVNKKDIIIYLQEYISDVESKYISMNWMLESNWYSRQRNKDKSDS